MHFDMRLTTSYHCRVIITFHLPNYLDMAFEILAGAGREIVDLRVELMTDLVFYPMNEFQKRVLRENSLQKFYTRSAVMLKFYHKLVPPLLVCVQLPSA